MTETMKTKTRNIINADNEDSKEPFAVYQHIILRNGWEYYLEEADSDGITFGYVMGFANEWGSVSMDEIKPYITSIVRGDELNYIMPPFNYYWEDEG
jgi:regulator of RNase E activity RraB